MLVDAQKNHNNEAVVERFFLWLSSSFFPLGRWANSTCGKAPKTGILGRKWVPTQPVARYTAKKTNGFL